MAALAHALPQLQTLDLGGSWGAVGGLVAAVSVFRELRLVRLGMGTGDLGPLEAGSEDRGREGEVSSEGAGGVWSSDGAGGSGGGWSSGGAVGSSGPSQAQAEGGTEESE